MIMKFIIVPLSDKITFELLPDVTFFGCQKQIADLFYPGLLPKDCVNVQHRDVYVPA